MKKLLTLCLTFLLTLGLCYPVPSYASSRKKRARTTQVSSSQASKLNGIWTCNTKSQGKDANGDWMPFYPEIYFNSSTNTVQFIDNFYLTTGRSVKRSLNFSFKNGIVYINGKQRFRPNFSTGCLKAIDSDHDWTYYR